jgi:hypothetical protein
LHFDAGFKKTILGIDIDIPQGAVIEAWDKGIRLVASLSDQHEVGTEGVLYHLKTPLTDAEFEVIAFFAWMQIGKEYDWTDVLRFISRRPGLFANLKPEHYQKWFCSCHVYATLAKAGRALFEHTEPWEVFPGLVHRSPLVDPNGEPFVTE